MKKPLFLLLLFWTGMQAAWAQTPSLFYKLVNDEAVVTYEANQAWRPKQYGAETIAIPDSVSIAGVRYPVVAVGDSAFYDERWVKHVQLGQHIRYIGVSAFSHCQSLETMVLSSRVDSICPNAFYMDNMLRTINFPDGLRFIGQNAFEDCWLLEEAILPDSLKTIQYGAFCECRSMTRLHIPEGLSNLEGNVFFGDTSLTEIRIPDHIRTIPSSCFIKCYSLEKLHLPDSLRQIDGMAFRWCRKLHSITFPRSFTTLNWDAFGLCSSLDTIRLKNPSPIWVDNMVFQGHPAGTVLVVPCGSEAAFRRSTWGSLFTTISEKPSFDLTLSCDTSMGHIDFICPWDCGVDTAIVRAEAKSGFAFVGWSDGCIDTLRRFAANRDYSLEARFLPYCHIQVFCDEELGSVSAPDSARWGDTVTLTVTVKDAAHYIFEGWSDGNTDNPRTLILSGDTTLVASIVGKTFSIDYVYDMLQGVVEGPTEAQYGDTIEVRAVPQPGYVFDHWNDQSTENPHTYLIRRDLQIRAFFEVGSGLDSPSESSSRPHKILHEGQLYILRDGRRYTILGSQN